MKAPAIETPAGRITTVVRHPRAGREVAVLGGARRFAGRDVIDIGCGDGRLAIDIARLARRVVGVDPGAGSIATATRRARELGLANLTFRVGTAQDLGVGRRRFDIAFFTWSL